MYSLHQVPVSHPASGSHLKAMLARMQLMVPPIFDTLIIRDADEQGIHDSRDSWWMGLLVVLVVLGIGGTTARLSSLLYKHRRARTACPNGNDEEAGHPSWSEGPNSMRLQNRVSEASRASDHANTVDAEGLRESGATIVDNFAPSQPEEAYLASRQEFAFSNLRIPRDEGPKSKHLFTVYGGVLGGTFGLILLLALSSVLYFKCWIRWRKRQTSNSDEAGSSAGPGVLDLENLEHRRVSGDTLVNQAIPENSEILDDTPRLLSSPNSLQSRHLTGRQWPGPQTSLVVASKRLLNQHVGHNRVPTSGFVLAATLAAMVSFIGCVCCIVWKIHRDSNAIIDEECGGLVVEGGEQTSRDNEPMDAIMSGGLGIERDKRYVRAYEPMDTIVEEHHGENRGAMQPVPDPWSDEIINDGHKTADAPGRYFGHGTTKWHEEHRRANDSDGKDTTFTPDRAALASTGHREWYNSRLYKEESSLNVGIDESQPLAKTTKRREDGAQHTRVAEQTISSNTASPEAAVLATVVIDSSKERANKTARSSRDQNTARLSQHKAARLIDVGVLLGGLSSVFKTDENTPLIFESGDESPRREERDSSKPSPSINQPSSSIRDLDERTSLDSLSWGEPTTASKLAQHAATKGEGDGSTELAPNREDDEFINILEQINSTASSSPAPTTNIDRNGEISNMLNQARSLDSSTSASGTLALVSQNISVSPSSIVTAIYNPRTDASLPDSPGKYFPAAPMLDYGQADYSRAYTYADRHGVSLASCRLLGLNQSSRRVILPIHNMSVTSGAYGGSYNSRDLITPLWTCWKWMKNTVGRYLCSILEEVRGLQWRGEGQRRRGDDLETGNDERPRKYLSAMQAFPLPRHVGGHPIPKTILDGSDDGARASGYQQQASSSAMRAMPQLRDVSERPVIQRPIGSSPRWGNGCDIDELQRIKAEGDWGSRGCMESSPFRLLDLFQVNTNAQRVQMMREAMTAGQMSAMQAPTLPEITDFILGDGERDEQTDSLLHMPTQVEEDHKWCLLVPLNLTLKEWVNTLLGRVTDSKIQHIHDCYLRQIAAVGKIFTEGSREYSQAQLPLERYPELRTAGYKGQ